MKTIIVKVNNRTKTLSEVLVKSGDKPVVIKASKKVNYELIDELTGTAPHHIITKRSGQDLHVSFGETSDADLIISGFYKHIKGALIGLAEDGQYYYFVPDTGYFGDYVTELKTGDTEGQALGGNAYQNAWWAGATNGRNAITPWLVVLAGVGAIVAIERSGKDEPAMATVDGVVNAQTVQEGSALLTTINLTNTNGNPSLSLVRTGTVSADDVGALVFSEGVSQNADGTLSVPKGVRSFTISTPILADNATETETIGYRVGGVGGVEAQIEEVPVLPAPEAGSAITHIVMTASTNAATSTINPHEGRVADVDDKTVWRADSLPNVVITDKGNGAFLVSKDGQDLIEFQGNLDGTYRISPLPAIEALGAEPLQVNFAKGEQAVTVDLMSGASTGIDVMHMITADSAKGIDFGLVQGVELVDLSEIAGGVLQNVTLSTIQANSQSGLYITGSTDDVVTLGSVIQSGDSQMDVTGVWQKGTTKTGSDINDDTTTIYNIWTHTDGLMLYIDKDITVL